jgi:hypothetical protein
VAIIGKLQVRVVEIADSEERSVGPCRSERCKALFEKADIR